MTERAYTAEEKFYLTASKLGLNVFAKHNEHWTPDGVKAFMSNDSGPFVCAADYLWLLKKHKVNLASLTASEERVKELENALTVFRDEARELNREIMEYSATLKTERAELTAIREAPISGSVEARLLAKIAELEDANSRREYYAKVDCNYALESMSAAGICTPAETYGVHTGWAIRELCIAVKALSAENAQLKAKGDVEKLEVDPRIYANPVYLKGLWRRIETTFCEQDFKHVRMLFDAEIEEMEKRKEAKGDGWIEMQVFAKALCALECSECAKGKKVKLNSAGFYSHRENGNHCNAHNIHKALAALPYSPTAEAKEGK